MEISSPLSLFPSISLESLARLFNVTEGPTCTLHPSRYPYSQKFPPTPLPHCVLFRHLPQFSFSCPPELLAQPRDLLQTPPAPPIPVHLP